ncbi:MAG: D-alanine--D-alanine ligase [Lachnospiraceae bacterium]|nr:D-alanine--D-alanine ligase [Lachnospiraceae bacterium]
MNIVVLAGGISTERDVSLISGKMIYRAVKKNGHNAILLDVFLGYEGDDAESVFASDKDWEAQVTGIKETNPDIEQIKALRPDWKKNFFGPNVLSVCQKADVVFMALHGENGENGKIQACFDLMGITYTGTDYVSSALSMDKGLTKDIFAQYGIPAPCGIRLKKGEKDPMTVPFPCIVKACCGGSSVGVSIAGNKEEYEAAKSESYKYDGEAIIEQYIEGREFSVGVLDGRALPVIEIAPLTGFYDYKNKYQAGSTIETCPADLSAEKTKEMQSYAEAAFRALRLKNYARMDFMMSKNGEIYCLEANTLPGMTPTSLLPQEAAAEGISFEQLCEKLIEVSLRDKADN